MGFLLHGKRFRVMEKKRTNSSPFRKSVDKHSIYPTNATLDKDTGFQGYEPEGVFGSPKKT
jgi:hypothetical protein